MNVHRVDIRRRRDVAVDGVVAECVPVDVDAPSANALASPTTARRFRAYGIVLQNRAVVPRNERHAAVDVVHVVTEYHCSVAVADVAAEPCPSN